MARLDFGLQTCAEFLSSFYSRIAMDEQSSLVDIGDMNNRVPLDEEKKEEQLETALGAGQIDSFPEEVPKPKECSLLFPTSR